METNLTTAQTKNLIRRARTDSRRMYELLDQVCLVSKVQGMFRRSSGSRVDANTVLAVASTYQAAQALDALARSVPLTRQVAQLRKVAGINLSLAEELLHCLASRANEGIRLR
ncbi:hypothetical protein [Deinococcus sp. SL84]|uniref:hypothetical protein n=1 Tax=Deinococcus sp. SL84 TaxID=2994663 RepID=UPI002272D64E|nr:hypothetical protein [Deinococcus sp. SL84]MCY1703604.1 hypothetical protein [Deinococcus sp. SL84]